MANMLSGLLQNKLLLRYLSGAGAAISADKPIAEGLDPITQEAIATQSFTKLLKKMIGGDIPEGGKMTVDSKGMSLNIPSGALDLGEGRGVASEDRGYLQPKAEAVEPTEGFAGITGADLAGLSPQDISLALTGALGVERLRQKKVTDLIGARYKKALIEDIETRADIAERTTVVAERREERLLEGVPDKVPVKIPDGRVIEVDPKEALSYYAKINNLPVTYDTYKLAMKDPEFFDYLKTMAKAGATQISFGERLDVKAKKYFTDPKGLTADVDKYINSEDVQGRLFQFVDPKDPDAARKREVATIREKEKFITGKIAAAGGEIVGAKLEDRTFIWTVKWPDGITSEVRYAN